MNGTSFLLQTYDFFGVVFQQFYYDVSMYIFFYFVFIGPIEPVVMPFIVLKSLQALCFNMFLVPCPLPFLREHLNAY